MLFSKACHFQAGGIQRKEDSMTWGVDRNKENFN